MSRTFRPGLRHRLMAAALLGLGAHAAVAAGERAWTRAQVSPGLHSPGRSVQVAYLPPGTIPPGARITHVHADRSYAGNADIQTALCWNGTSRCVDLSGPSIQTRAFEGLAADRPFYLVHLARAWHGSARPVFVKGNVTVWYETP